MHVRRKIAASVLAVVAVAHPSNLECNDPRFDHGYGMMSLSTQRNQNDPALSFTADVESYDHGDVVTFTVKALGLKYVNEPYGVYLALRARPTLGYASDYGSFGNLSPDLQHTLDKATQGDCANTVYSASPFNGSATLTWTAGPLTYDNVTFTLLWGNGVGPDDTMASKFPKLTHGFNYRRTLTLRGPPMPDDPPQVQQGTATSACEAALDGSYNHPHAPVFVQTLRTFPAKSVTFPSGQCIPCREDQTRCRSAVVECPTEPGLLAIQRLYSSSGCSGEAVVSKLPTSFVYCPAPAYHSPENLDLERFVLKLQRDHSLYFIDEATARIAIAEYRRMLLLIQKFPDAPVVPSKLVDLVWHEHILDTKTYKEDSQRLFGKYVHHAPAFGDDEDEVVKAEKETMLKDQALMFEKYTQLFEELPPRAVWPTATAQSRGRLPDCCKAACVKPDCASCVGCNAVSCGTLKEDHLLQASEHVLPDHFAGYVPAPLSLQATVDQSYLCTATPMTGMTFSWTISGDLIYMSQSLEEKETWYGLGFTDVAPYNMGFSDFIVTLFNNNYTGVRDLYKYDAGNAYPCWDVLHQCSADGTAGTMDLSDRTNTRASGLSSSAWTRPLVTGDAKDSSITDVTKKVMFAYGSDDTFIYHGSNQRVICDINFFSGSVSCPTPGRPSFSI